MIITKTFDSREAWLKGRENFIGGSDASCIMGENPWKSNVDLYLEKTGQKEPADLSNNELVNYGAAAEQYHRELFKLDYPEYSVKYAENNMWLNSDYPWAHASLDGWLYDDNGDLGIFECKTATLSNAAQRRKWEGANMPNYYYWQVIHYMLVTDAKFAILRAQLKTNRAGEEVGGYFKHYRITRAEAETNMYRLMIAEKEFYEHIKRKECPAKILPLL